MRTGRKGSQTNNWAKDRKKFTNRSKSSRKTVVVVWAEAERGNIKRLRKKKTKKCIMREVRGGTSEMESVQAVYVEP